MNRPLPAALSHWVARSQQWAAGHRLQIANCLALGRRLVDQLFVPHLRRWFPALGARQADHLPEVEGNLDQADWPAINDGVMRLSKAQFEALFEGIDWVRRYKPAGGRG